MNITSHLAKWLFLAVVITVACLGNMIAFDKDVGTGPKAFALTAVNIFALSLLAFWFGGYAQRSDQKAKLLIIGHAALMLAVGVGLVGWGYRDGLLKIASADGSPAHSSCLVSTSFGQARSSSIA
jgi:hypothetical protein